MDRRTARSEDGTCIWFDDSGETGEPLLFVHGFSGSSSAARHFARRSAAAGRRFIRMDLRGHGLSDKPMGAGAYDLGRFAEDVVAVVDACGANTAHVAGHCLGGVVAVRAALDHPERIASLSLVSTSTRPAKDVSPMPGWARFARRRGRGLARAVLPVRGARMPHVDYDRFDDMGDWYWRRMLADYRALSGAVAFAVLDALEDVDLLEDSRSLVPRALVVHGARDSIFPVAAAERLAAAAPHARLVVMPGHNHVTPVLDPGSAMFDTVLSFAAEA